MHRQRITRATLIAARADPDISLWFQHGPGVNTPLCLIIVRPKIHKCLHKRSSLSLFWCYYSVAAASSTAEVGADASDPRRIVFAGKYAGIRADYDNAFFSPKRLLSSTDTAAVRSPVGSQMRESCSW